MLFLALSVRKLSLALSVSLDRRPYCVFGLGDVLASIWLESCKFYGWFRRCHLSMTGYIVLSTHRGG
jgi:hypothetical protein